MHVKRPLLGQPQLQTATKQKRGGGFRSVINIAIVTCGGCPANLRGAATSLRATSCLKVSRRQKKVKAIGRCRRSGQFLLSYGRITNSGLLPPLIP